MNDLYESDSGSQPEAPEKKPETTAEEGPTALLPKSILGGKTFKVGEEVVLKITGIHADQVSVAYADEKPAEGSEEPAPGEESEPEPAMDGGEDQSLYS
jgi:hypothetical protein